MNRENKQLAPKKKEVQSTDYTELADSCSNTVVSGTECTGLIPTPPEDEQQSEAYADLYTIPKPDEGNGKAGRKRTGKD